MNSCRWSVSVAPSPPGFKQHCIKDCFWSLYFMRSSLRVLSIPAFFGLIILGIKWLQCVARFLAKQWHLSLLWKIPGSWWHETAGHWRVMLSKIYACCLLKPILTSSVHCSPVPLNALHGPNDNDTSFPSDFGEMLRRWHYVFVFPDESDDANNADYWNSLMPDASEAWDRTHRSWRTRYQGYQPQALSSLANFIDFYIYIYLS